MTVTESLISRANPASLAEAPAQTFAEQPGGQQVDHADSYMLRLCLDLQLDAALLTLGAAARDTLTRDGRRDGGSVIPRPPVPMDTTVSAPPVPWRRWLNEDVDMMCALAASLSAGPPVLPSTLEVGVGDGPSSRVLGELLERYEAIRDVLAEVLAARPPGAQSGGWRPRILTALSRCQTRLQELVEFTEPLPPSSPAPRSRYLPGELLG